MIQYEEDGHNVTQKYSIFVLQARSAKNMKFFDWPKLDQKKSFFKKSRIQDGFVIIPLSCDASRIIKITLEDIRESTMLNSPE